jgi:nitronate monooxygenase
MWRTRCRNVYLNEQKVFCFFSSEKKAFLTLLERPERKQSLSLPPILANRLRLPVIGAPLFIVSNPDLVIAQCKAGVVGSFPALNARPGPVLEEWLQRITSELAEYDAAHPEAPSAPFAVNQIVHRTNERLMHDVEMCVKYKVPVVITSLGARTDVNEAIHSYGGIVFHDIINIPFAKKALEKGADGLIAVAAGAGGHAGVLSPFALVAEIRQFFDGPLALSGAISTGAGILAAQAAGADVAYIGSAFIATEEANAVAAYKQSIVESHAADIVYSNLFTGVHGNYLRSSIAAQGLDPDALPHSDPTQMNFASTSAKAWRDIWGAGQGVGSVEAVVPAATRIAEWQAEYQAARTRVLAA